MTLDDSPQSRSDLQAALRKEHRKEKRHQHRWRRRILIALGVVVLIAVLGAAGIYEYANYQFNQIKKIHSKHLVAQAPPGQPFTMLFVGSDSRQFVDDDNSTQVNAFGTTGDAGGQRSDVTMVARFVPATKTVTVMSIPRDLWVNIPGDVTDISGMNRINAAFNSGPDLLIQTIEEDLGIPINHYVAVGFPGFSGMVNVLGGITMDFPTPVKDQYTGLDVTTTGCQTVNGTVALQLVRSRHLYYMDQYGNWDYDGQSDFSRIQRQDAFFRRRAGQGEHALPDQPARRQLVRLRRRRQLDHRRHPERGRPPPPGGAVQGPAVVTLHHRDAADDRLRDLRRCGRLARSAALGRRDDQHVQAARPAHPQAGPDDHHDRARRAARPDQRPGPECVHHQRAGALHRDGPAPPRVHHRRDRGRHHVAAFEHIGDPVRSRRAPGGAHAGGGLERAGDLRRGAEPERADADVAGGGAAAHRDPIGSNGDHDHDHPVRADDDHHDDDPTRRLHEHAARALEPLPVHARSDVAGGADESRPTKPAAPVRLRRRPDLPTPD